MEKIRKNVVVSFNYDLKDPEGNLIDRSDEGPLEYIHGHRNIVAGLENKLEGLGVGDKLNVIVTPDEGYGEFDQALVFDADIAAFGDIDELEVGMLVQGGGEEGDQVLRVVEITEKIVKLDGNHPLAGMTLHFDVEVVALREATSQELDHGHIHHGGHDHH